MQHTGDGYLWYTVTGKHLQALKRATERGRISWVAVLESSNTI
jgi:hypothetical protein